MTIGWQVWMFMIAKNRSICDMRTVDSNLLFSAVCQTEESKSAFSIRSIIQSEAFANSIL